MKKTLSGILVILSMLLSLAGGLVLSSSAVFAQTVMPQFPITITPPDDINPTGLSDIQQVAPDYPNRTYTLQDPQLSDIPLLIEYAIRFLLGIAGVVTMYFFLDGAFMYLFMIPIDKKQEGRTRMIYSIEGFVIILLSYMIVDIVIRLLF